MEKPAQIRRFRTNPVEILIFSVVTAIFVKSVYTLVYDPQSSTPMTVAAIAANPLTEGRAPASVITPSYLNIDVKCEAPFEQDTSASKVRLSGAFCGLPSPTDGSKLARITVLNSANKYAATVFPNINGAKFSTDYIPLNAGKNPIQLQFSYRDGKTVAQEVTVTKN